MQPVGDAQEAAPAAEGAATEHPKTSRICVKNLPKYVDEKRLKEHFSLKGEVTDTKIMRTRDGKSRCFGFVGFRTVEEAEAAQRYFNKSFMDTMRLMVEFAYKFGSSEAPRAWSKYTAGSSAHKKLQSQAAPTGSNAAPLGNGSAAGAEGSKHAGAKKKKKGAEGALAEEEDPTLREFMHLMQPRSKQAIWANDDLMPEGRPGARPGPGAAGAAGTAAGKKGKGGRAGGEQLAPEDDEVSDSDDEYQELPGAATGSAAAAAGAAESLEEEGSEQKEDVAEDSGRDSDGERPGRGQRDAVVANAAVSDLDYLKSRVRKNFDSDEEEEQEGGEESLSESEDAWEHAGSGPESEAGEAAPTTTAAAAGGGGSSSEGEEEGEEELEEGNAVGPGPGSTRRQQQQQQHQAKASGRQKRGSQRAAADDLDAIFARAGRAGQTEGSRDEEMADAAGEEEVGASSGSGSEGEEEAAAEGMEMEDGSSPASGGSGRDEEEELEQQAQGQQQQRLREVKEAGDDASIAETGRLFVRNLPYTASEEDLRELFEQIGEVAEVHLVLDRLTKKSKGFAHVQFASPDDAVKAHAQLDASIFQGRLLHILPGKRPPQPPSQAAAAAAGEEGGEEGGGKSAAGSSYKAAKEQQLKAQAHNRTAWNTLFMRADTVAEAVAAHYGVSKSELLDREAGDLAVRMALGETQVIAATKAALGEAGADVGKLEEAASAAGRASASKSVPRSDSVLLVKNLPHTATEAELESVFGAMGALGRLVLPPTKTLALVEYLEPQDARKAFTALAYKRFQHVPLYLEWAPKGIFTTPPPPPGAPRAQTKPAAAGKADTPAAAGKGKGAKGLSEAVTGLAEAEAADADVESSTIYVKNLAFASSEAALRQHFEQAVSQAGGSIRAVKVAKKKGPDGKALSAGFGFVECSSEAVARAVIRTLQSSSLDGHRLVLQLSQQQQQQQKGAKGGKAAGAGTAAAAAGQQGKAQGKKGALPDTSKMVVRNVAFEATRKDIMGLFTPFGHVKSCRLPRKFDGSHRGFAFVDFATKQEARNAMDAVAGTHLYGRRLVLEWAEEEGGLDELRAKTAAKFKGEAGLGAGGRGSAAAVGEGEEEEGEGGAGARPPPAKRRRK